MNIIHFLFVNVILFSTSNISADQTDSRTLVEMPPMMQQYMLGNMRDHLSALTEIQQSFSLENFEKAADIAEQRIGMSSMISHGASHMAGFMPKPMQEIGTQMHKSASQFALIDQESAIDNDLKRPLLALSKITQQCVACHISFRIR